MEHLNGDPSYIIAIGAVATSILSWKRQKTSSCLDSASAFIGISVLHLKTTRPDFCSAFTAVSDVFIFLGIGFPRMEWECQRRGDYGRLLFFLRLFLFCSRFLIPVSAERQATDVYPSYRPFSWPAFRCTYLLPTYVILSFRSETAWPRPGVYTRRLGSHRIETVFLPGVTPPILLGLLTG